MTNLIQIYCDMITVIGLVNPSINVHNYFFSSVVRTPKIYSLSNIQVYNTKLLTIVTMLYIRLPKFIHLIPESLYLIYMNVSTFWPISSPFPPLASLWHAPFNISLVIGDFFFLTGQVSLLISTELTFLLLTTLILMVNLSQSIWDDRLWLHRIWSLFS